MSVDWGSRVLFLLASGGRQRLAGQATAVQVKQVSGQGRLVGVMMNDVVR